VSLHLQRPLPGSKRQHGRGHENHGATPGRVPRNKLASESPAEAVVKGPMRPPSTRFSDR
jgi:hypothetical protein